MPRSVPPPAHGPIVLELLPDRCLDYVNTRAWRGRPQPEEQLSGPAQLLAWCGSGGGMPASVMTGTAAAWQSHARQAATEFALALGWREAMYRILASLGAAAAPAASDLEAINTALARVPARSQLAATPGAPGWTLAQAEPRAAFLLAPTLWSFGDLLAGPRRQRIRCCANPECLWAFADDSRAGNRRWCDMKACGNRAKARRHYRRRQMQ